MSGSPIVTLAGVFVKSGGRLVAVGGTRAVDRPLKKIEIVRPPRLHSTPKVRLNLDLNHCTNIDTNFLLRVIVGLLQGNFVGFCLI